MAEPQAKPPAVKPPAAKAKEKVARGSHVQQSTINNCDVAKTKDAVKDAGGKVIGETESSVTFSADTNAFPVVQKAVAKANRPAPTKS